MLVFKRWAGELEGPILGIRGRIPGRLRRKARMNSVAVLTRIFLRDLLPLGSETILVSWTLVLLFSVGLNLERTPLTSDALVVE